MRTLTATDARVRFGLLLRRVAEDGETIVVERGGKAQAVVLPLDEYQRLCELRNREESWDDLLDDVIAAVDRDLAGRRLPAPDDVIREMREERDAELSRLR